MLSFSALWPALAENSALVFLCAAGVILAAGGGVILFRSRSNPRDRERRRRLAVNQKGRLSEALITDVNDGILHYTYRVGGVSYAASQDVSALRDQLPDDPARLIGQAYLKYAPRNPANSILVCEQWSGLRKPPSPIQKGA